MKTIEDLIRAHPFFKDFSDNHLKLIAGCGKNQVFEAQQWIAKQAEPADHFFLIREGEVGITAFNNPQTLNILQTLSSGEIFGWSWLFEPHEWMFGAKALSRVHLISLDGNV